MNVFSRRMLCFFLMSLCMVFFVGCASDGSFKNPFASNNENAAPTPEYYYSEFADIPIPSDMTEKRDDSFITFSPSGIKCGLQRFSGRLETVSLMNTMRRYMSSNGWVLRSLVRAKNSELIFEKSDRLASLQVTDGLIFTDLRISVTSRLEGDLPNFSGSPSSASGSEAKLSQ